MPGILHLQQMIVFPISSSLLCKSVSNEPSNGTNALFYS